MSLKLGNLNINKIYLGSTLINKAYLGSNQIYPTAGAPGPPPIEGFETLNTDTETFWTGDSITFGGSAPGSVTRVTDHATQGTYSWQIQSSASTWGGWFSSGLNLTGATTLELDIYVTSAFSSSGIKLTATGNSSAASSPFTGTGSHTLTVDLTGISDLSSVEIELGTGGTIEDAVNFYIDNLRAS